MYDKKFSNAIEYIKIFLTYGNMNLAEKLYYTDESFVERICHSTSGTIIIVASGFFRNNIYGTHSSMPESPLKKWKGIPVLFGDVGEKIINGNRIIYSDLIASAYYLLSRYEEMIYPNIRDIYRIFPARESLLYKNGILERPIIDEYSEQILSIFQEMDNKNYAIKQKINRIYFTHDIDIPFNRYSFTTMVKAMGGSLVKNHRIIFYPFLNWLGLYKINPKATWRYMLSKEKEVQSITDTQVESICFIVALEVPDSKSMAYIKDKKTKEYLQEMTSGGAKLGLHTSYKAAESADKVKEEKRRLEQVAEQKIIYQRNHYLRQINPEDMEWYEKAGIREDFTTGYNEMPGFRLGTTRSVRWINPKTGQLHDIILHGLNIMDGSLSGAKPYQLELGFEDARKLCKKIIDQIKKYNGDLCLLWHNGMFEKYPGNYQKKLYDWVIEYCKEMLI